MAGYARNILEKYGWIEGKGLGKAESGMVEALKPKLKFDKTGIGHDHAEQFTFNWWEIAFNDAAKRVSVDVGNGKSRRPVEADDHCLSNKRPSIAKLINENPLKYGKFIKTETLTSGGKVVPVKHEMVTSPEVDECATNTLSNLTDDELLKICGGRTAHKAARHGHKLVGKLARVIQQEKVHLSTSEVSFEKEEDAGLELAPGVNLEGDGGERKRKKKKKKRTKSLLEEEESERICNAPCTADYDVTETAASTTSDIEAGVAILECKEVKKRKKKKKRKSMQSGEVGGGGDELLVISKWDRKRSCPSKDTVVNDCKSEHVLEYEGDDDCKKHRAKRKKK